MITGAAQVWFERIVRDHIDLNARVVLIGSRVRPDDDFVRIFQYGTEVSGEGYARGNSNPHTDHVHWHHGGVDSYYREQNYERDGVDGGAGMTLDELLGPEVDELIRQSKLTD